MLSYRLQKLESSITRLLSVAVVQRAVRDPRINPLIAIFKTKLSKDLHYATVLVAGNISNRSLRKSVVGLNHAAGFLQQHIAHHMRMRNIPKLRFLADQSIAHGFDMVHKIEQHTTGDYPRQ